jgi:ribosomal protein L21
MGKVVGSASTGAKGMPGKVKTHKQKEKGHMGKTRGHRENTSARKEKISGKVN